MGDWNGHKHTAMCNTENKGTLWASLEAQLVKNPPAMRENLGLIPQLGRSLGEGKDYPLQYSGLENSIDYPWGYKESDRTERPPFTFKEDLNYIENRKLRSEC